MGDEIELKPCPFFGYKEIKFGNSFWDGIFVYCPECGVQTDYACDDKEIVAKQRVADVWNRRVGDDD